MNFQPCPVCASYQATVLFSGVTAPETGQRRWVVARCNRCSTCFLQPRPKHWELANLYPQHYEPFQPPVDDQPNPLWRWLWRRHYALRAHAVHRTHPAGGMLLDIGCATGNLLREVCRDERWHGAGLDLNTRALIVARRQGIHAWCGEATNIAMESASCDVVTMWEVIEHVPDPQKTLAEVRRVLKPGGVLLLSTPNSASWQARLWGRHWAGWDVPRHLQIFSFHSLQHLLHTGGFQIVRRFALPLERFYLVESLRRRLQAGHSLSRWTEHVAVLLGLVAWPFLRLSDALPAASAIVLEAHAV